MELENFLLSLIKSLQTFNFPMFRGCLENIAPWMFEINRTNYACCLPIFIHDLKSLQPNHPEVRKEFCQGTFMNNKSGKPFYSMGIDQAHEQTNELVKKDDGATDLANNNAALLKQWQVLRSLKWSEASVAMTMKTEIPHHKDTDVFNRQFREDVKSLCYERAW